MAIKSKKVKCRVCGKTQNRQPKVWRHYLRCARCGSLWIDSFKQVTYAKDYYHRGRDGWWMRLIDRLSFWDRFSTLGLKKKEKILEIGFGEGKFILGLWRRKYNVYGVELSDFARENAAKMIGNSRVFSKIEELDTKFNVIVLYHVLEHIQSPREYLDKIKRVLVPGGRLVVRVPNVNSWEAKIARDKWYHIDYPNHPIIFSDIGLVKIMKDAGLERIKVRLPIVEYRQVMGYSLLSVLNINLQGWLMVIYQILTIPILSIFLVLVAQHGVVEVEGRVDSSIGSK